MSVELGDAFENDVAELFRGAGYRVTQRTERRGFEFDLIVSDGRGHMIPTNVAVECKYRSKAAVSNTDVGAFVTNFMSRRDDLGLQQAIMVTNTSYSRQAHETVVGKANIRLLTFAELEYELAGGFAYLRQSSELYKSEPSRTLIDLPAHLDSPGGQPIGSIIKHAEDRINSSLRSALIILGDFGSGKTTVAEQLHKRLAQAFLNRSSDVFPFLFYLSPLTQYETADRFVTAQIRLAVPSASGRLIDTMAKRGRTVLILDGFDEVATNANANERHSAFLRVFSLARRASHLVLTSRPGGFTSLGEVRKLVSELVSSETAQTHNLSQPGRPSDQGRWARDVVPRNAERRRAFEGMSGLFPSSATSIAHLQPLSKKSILSYLSGSEREIRDSQGLGPEEVYAALEHMHDLSGLISRPILLEMLVDLLINKAVMLSIQGAEVGPVFIYSAYVNFHLDREWATRQFNSRADRLAFARAAAIAMLEAGGALEASDEAIVKIMKRADGRYGDEGVGPRLSYDPMAISDFRICGFLSISKEDKIVFSHKSFMEYFVADVVFQKIKSGEFVAELDINLNYEILYFVGGLIYYNSEYRQVFLDHIAAGVSRHGEAYVENAKLIVLYSDMRSERRVFSDIEKHVRITKKNFAACRFPRFKVTTAIVTQCQFQDCAFEDTAFGGEVDKVVFSRCSGDVELSANCHRLEFLACMNLTISGVSRFAGVKMRSVALQIVSRGLSIENGSIEDAQLLLEGLQSLNLTDCALKNVSIQTGIDARPFPVSIKFQKSTFDRAVLTGAYIDWQSYRRLVEGKFPGLRGYAFVNCGAAEHLFRDDKEAPGASRLPDQTYPDWRRVGDLIFIHDSAKDKIEGAIASLEALVKDDEGLTAMDGWCRENLSMRLG